MLETLEKTPINGFKQRPSTFDRQPHHHHQISMTSKRQCESSVYFVFSISAIVNIFFLAPCFVTASQQKKAATFPVLNWNTKLWTQPFHPLEWTDLGRLVFSNDKLHYYPFTSGRGAAPRVSDHRDIIWHRESTFKVSECQAIALIRKVIANHGSRHYEWRNRSYRRVTPPARYLWDSQVVLWLSL